MQNWEEYLSKILGQRVGAERDTAATNHIPIAMGTVYDIYSGQLLDKKVRFAVLKQWHPPLPELLRYYRILTSNLDGEVVMILPAAKPYEVERLVAERIPFVVPGRQVFLPRNVVFMQTPPSAGAQKADVEGPLSPRAQALLMFHLQKQALAGQTQIAITSLLKWNAMTVSRAVQELQSKRLGYTVPVGRGNMFFLTSGPDCWREAEPRLTSPVRTRRFVRLPEQPKNRAAFLEAGITALSRYTMLNEDPVPVHAIHDRAFTKLLRAGEVTVSPYQDEGCVQLELWRYDPAPLAEKNTVDRLSLYLSLKGHPDERVEGALHELMENIPCLKST